MFERHSENPIIIPDPALWWANKKIYNCAVLYENKLFHMLFRAVGEDGFSRLGYAKSSDGYHFEKRKTPAFYPTEIYNARGTEDPSISKIKRNKILRPENPSIALIDENIFIPYNAFDGHNARIALARTNDFESFIKHDPLIPNWDEGIWPPWKVNTKGWSKAGSFFPEKTKDGKFSMLFGDYTIQYAQSEDLVYWNILGQVLGPTIGEGRFDSGYVENGSPPIRIKDGWFIFYNGVHRLDDVENDPRVYSIGAAILDFDEPQKVLWRSKKPILFPEMPYEIKGMIDLLMDYEQGDFEHFVHKYSAEDIEELARTNNLPRALFCRAAAKVGKNYQIWYGAADTVICTASGSFNDVLGAG